MRDKSHRQKPSDFHVPCETPNCKNYYNAMYKNATGLCRPCEGRVKRERIKKKRDKEG